MSIRPYFARYSFFSCISSKVFRDMINIDFVYNHQKLSLWMPAIDQFALVLITAFLYNRIVINLNLRKLFRMKSQHLLDFVEKQSSRTTKMLIVMMMLHYSITISTFRMKHCFCLAIISLVSGLIYDEPGNRPPSNHPRLCSKKLLILLFEYNHLLLLHSSSVVS